MNSNKLLTIELIFVVLIILFYSLTLAWRWC